MVMPRIYGVFHRHFEGDDALLNLARRRLEQIGIGAELYPSNVEHALAEWPLIPRTTRLHFADLPRHLDVLSSQQREEIGRFAVALSGKAQGMVVHDQPAWLDRPSDVVAALQKTDKSLGANLEAPPLYVEYASGLPIDWFIALAEQVRDLEHVHICLDVGHVVLRCTRAHFERRRPGVDMWSLARDGERARAWLVDLEHAMDLGIVDLLAMIWSIVALGRPVHFHLHDAHPLSLLSRYGVSDHLSFLQTVPVTPIVYRAGATPSMLGARGLSEILRRVILGNGTEQATLSLEIHPTNEGRREPLGADADLFAHWTDLAHAELTNAWLSTLAENVQLLRDTWAKLEAPAAQPDTSGLPLGLETNQRGS